MSPTLSPRNLQEAEKLKILGAQIRKWREAKGLTQERFSSVAGFTRSYVTKIETGNRNISFLLLLKVISVLDVSEQELSTISREIWLK